MQQYGACFVGETDAILDTRRNAECPIHDLFVRGLDYPMQSSCEADLCVLPIHFLLNVQSLSTSCVVSNCAVNGVLATLLLGYASTAHGLVAFIEWTTAIVDVALVVDGKRCGRTGRTGRSSVPRVEGMEERIDILRHAFRYPTRWRKQ